MDLFVQISIIIVIAALVAVFARSLRQPLIIGYIITGLLVGPYLFNLIQDAEVINVFSEIGIALLLFIVGLGLNPKLIREVGSISLITGVGQVIFTSLFGVVIAQLLGFSFVNALYIATALTFSSTIIIVKLLSDKGDMQKLYGKIALGFLLVQDIVATIILISVSALAGGGNVSSLIGGIIVQGLALIVLAIFVSAYILPPLSAFFARSQEFLFLFAIAWGFGWATLFYLFGFSVEIGALIAGVTLSVSPYAVEISAKMRPLRDFFIILFFILLGSKMAVGGWTAMLLPATVFSLFVLIGNPLIVMALMGVLGYNKRTGFLAGLTVAQISEFSLILIILGVKMGHLSENILSLVTLVGLITIAGSTYFIMYAERLYSCVAPLLSIFERKKTKPETAARQNYDIILFGHNRIGYDFIGAFKKIKKNFLVIDFDPRIIRYLEDKDIPRLYGDASDSEFLDELPLSKIKLVISTIPDFATNLLLIKKIRPNNKKTVIMVISHNISEAEKLYAAGASYVILPHFLGGNFASGLITKYGLDPKKYSREKTSHLKYLAQRKLIGHEHPARTV
ncbi:sodium:proton exchanger [Candidatus Falkowbacteria bacterium CG10_big_fil_rev_8_21_14_0_10_44_15]|uniref:Sodium:proton exchanger n=1 Tax=Candidatus Falkowbacteria bacterium CG10_big_fil_rev_8_21_14_0_10_44_15 TaxID=1974569 RepID=A0A2H0UZ92_9BACT|nr:MAG: sodium:proton exchanger [Candidatus Falkowbacteria bacterium CG10_big_fil_rev_8_21_14_0_10_44_15]